jgi:hypothetical protein
MRTPNSFDSLDPIPSKLGCVLEAPRPKCKEALDRQKAVENWMFESADHRLVVDLPTLTWQEVTEADCRQIRTKSEYNTFIERQKELVKEAAQIANGFKVGDRVEVVETCDSEYLRPGMVGVIIEETVAIGNDKTAWHVQMDCGARHRYARPCWIRRAPSVVQSGDE